MLNYKNLPIRYKLFSGFIIVWVIFLCSVVYILIASGSFYESLYQLDLHGDKRILYANLNTDTLLLSDTVKSYMITKDPRWEKQYDSDFLKINKTLSTINDDNDQKDTGNLDKFKQTFIKLQGVELLILEKTKEGQTPEALKLFNNYYNQQQAQLTSISNNLVTNEDNEFDIILNQITTTINEGKIVFSLSLIFMLVMMLLIGFYSGSVIEKSINELLKSVQKIAAGDLSARANVNSSDEIGKLAQAFNSMAQQLQQLYSGLEGKVTEKTKELSEAISVLGQEKTKDEAILESIGDGMIVTDNNGKIMMMNEVTKQMLGLQNESFLNKTTFDLFQLYSTDNTVVPEDRRPLTIALRTGKKISEMFNFIDKSKKTRVMNLTATPVIEQGQIIGAVELIRDITKEKEIDRMKTEFISLASHQLRTPLSAIKWFSEMLVGGDAGQLTDEQKDFAQNISDSTERMIELVNSLLNISRIESGRILIDPKPTDLKELVDGIVNELQVKIKQKQLSLIVSVHSDLPKINLDPKLIRQVYMNLLTNSIKYTPKGGEISIFISRKDDQIVSQVTDNGYGIPKEQQDKIFQKFFRAENIIKVETDGTGLGLYLIKAIIESSNGKIWFISDEGKGTSFFFSLPTSGMLAKKGEVTLDE